MRFSRNLGIIFVCACVISITFTFVHRTIDNRDVSSREVSKKPALASENASRILYWSRHHATLANMKYVAGYFNITMDDIKPQRFQNYGISEDDANEVIKTNLIPILCKNYPVIVVSDTIPDARPFLQYEDCEASIILEVTNRFDWGLGGSERDSFIQLIRKRASQAKADGSPRLFLTANNPWDVYNTKTELGLEKSTPIPLIRPFGVDPVSVNEAVASDPTTKQTVCGTNMNDELERELLAKKISVKRLPYHYGGPKTLAFYKANVVVPYQVSVMKMLENLYEGVTTLIPSPEFYKNLTMEWKDFGFVKDVVKLPNWTEFVEYYCPDFKEYFYYFDSWEHLKQLVEQNGPIKTDDRVERGQKAATRMREEGLEKWRKLFVQTRILPGKE